MIDDHLTQSNHHVITSRSCAACSGEIHTPKETDSFDRWGSLLSFGLRLSLYREKLAAQRSEICLNFMRLEG